MRHLSREIVCAIVFHARAFNEDEVMPRVDSPAEGSPEAEGFGLADNPPDLETIELERLIGELNVDEAAELVALFLIGRGDFGRDEFEAAMAEARADETRSTAHYLMASPLLAEHLEAGLNAFGQTCEDDDLP
jgi:hypothetical protein